MVDLDLILYSEHMVGADSPDYSDTLNRALLEVIEESGTVPTAFPGFALRPTVAPTIGQFYVATDVDVGASWTTLTTALITDLAAAATGITKVGTINTGVWQGTSIATTYTDAKIKTVTGTSNRLTIGGTSTDPTFDISTSYAGQATITTLGTIVTGVWNGTSIGTAYTDAKIATVTGTTDRVTITGTATAPIFNIAATYVGQNTITTLGTVTTGTWNATQIANAYIATGLDVTKLTVGTTLPSNVVTSSLTALGTIATGVWQGTSISTTYTDAKVVSVTGTSNRITIGGTAGAPTIDVSTSYVGQATITTVGTISTGTWAATAITVDKGGTNLTSYTIGDTVYASGATTLSKLAIGTPGQFKIVNGGATAPTWVTLTASLITDLASATTGITKVGTVTTGVWNAGIISPIYGGTGVNNGSSNITIGGALTFSGAFATTITVTAGTTVTLPTTGTLVNTAVTTLGSLTSVGGAFAISGAFTGATTGSFSGAINGQTISSAASLTGTLAVASTINGQTISSAAAFTGTMSVAGVLNPTSYLKMGSPFSVSGVAAGEIVLAADKRLVFSHPSAAATYNLAGLVTAGSLGLVIGDSSWNTNFSGASFAFGSGAVVFAGAVTGITTLAATSIGIAGGTSYAVDIVVGGFKNTVGFRAASNTSGDIWYYATGTVTGDATLFASTVSATGVLDADFRNQNNSNAAAHSRVFIRTGGASGGDPYVRFGNAVVDWSFGMDNSDSDQLKVSFSDTLGSSDIMAFSSSLVKVVSGIDFQLGRAASASIATPSTHKIQIKDSAGTTYYALVSNV